MQCFHQRLLLNKAFSTRFIDDDECTFLCLPRGCRQCVCLPHNYKFPKNYCNCCERSSRSAKTFIHYSKHSNTLKLCIYFIKQIPKLNYHAFIGRYLNWLIYIGDCLCVFIWWILPCEEAWVLKCQVPYFASETPTIKLSSVLLIKFSIYYHNSMIFMV